MDTLAALRLPAALATAFVLLLSACGGGVTAEAPAGTETFAIESSTHTEDDVDYPQTPPVGGPHNPTWQNCGFYEAPIANENAVHSLEHGAVWITYAPDLDGAEIDTIRDLAGEAYVLASPFDGLPTPVVASAWGAQLQVTGADDPALAAFITTYANSPDGPEPGAPCTGGTDETTG